MRDARIGVHQTHTTQNRLRKFFKLKGDDSRWKMDPLKAIETVLNVDLLLEDLRQKY